MFDDIGIVEVALRNAISSELARMHGITWFDEWALFDDDRMALIASAKVHTGFGKLQVDDEVKHGKLVASLMFGFWVKLLGKGSFQGVTSRSVAPVKRRVIYDTVLWRAGLHQGFAGAGEMERSRVEKPAVIVKAIRNRVAHHESVIWGIPLPGQVDHDGAPRRLSVADSHRHVLDLAGLIDPDLGLWLASNSCVPALIAEPPHCDVRSMRL